jgi:hypothetical protein
LISDPVPGDDVWLLATGQNNMSAIAFDRE